VGPEIPLSLGIVDEFTKRNLKIFGPSQKAAEIETSKTFAKSFMQKNKIPTADSKTFLSAAEIIEHVKNSKFPLVVKTDGLAYAGKQIRESRGKSHC